MATRLRNRELPAKCLPARAVLAGVAAIACHNRAVRGTGDFIWAVSLHAFRPNQNFSARGNLENAPEVRELRALMRSAQRANRRVLRNRQAPRN